MRHCIGSIAIVVDDGNQLLWHYKTIPSRSMVLQLDGRMVSRYCTVLLYGCKGSGAPMRVDKFRICWLVYCFCCCCSFPARATFKIYKSKKVSKRRVASRYGTLLSLGELHNCINDLSDWEDSSSRPRGLTDRPTGYCANRGRQAVGQA